MFSEFRNFGLPALDLPKPTYTPSDCTARISPKSYFLPLCPCFAARRVFAKSERTYLNEPFPPRTSVNAQLAPPDSASPKSTCLHTHLPLNFPLVLHLLVPLLTAATCCHQVSALFKLVARVSRFLPSILRRPCLLAIIWTLFKGFYSNTNIYVLVSSLSDPNITPKASFSLCDSETRKPTTKVSIYS